MSQYITDLQVSLTSSEEQQLEEQGFTNSNIDLNLGSGGNRIYLWYKKGMEVESAITRIQMSFTDEMNQGLINAGYKKINKNLNTSAGGDTIYMWFRRGYSENHIPIVELAVTTDPTDEAELFATGWERLACDLNRNNKGNRIYLWVKREKATYICNVTATADFQSDDTNFQKGYIRIDEDTNRGAGGKKVFLWYRQTSNTENAISDLQISISDEEYNNFKRQKYDLVNVNLNEETRGDPVYLWYKRGGPGNPIKIMSVITECTNVEPFQKKGVKVIKKSLNSDNKGNTEYLCYYQ